MTPANEGLFRWATLSESRLVSELAEQELLQTKLSTALGEDALPGRPPLGQKRVRRRGPSTPGHQLTRSTSLPRPCPRSESRCASANSSSARTLPTNGLTIFAAANSTNLASASGSGRTWAILTEAP